MNKASFWLVWGVGGLPVIFAALMYFTDIGVPSDRNHSGELLSNKHIDSWQLNRTLKDRHWKILLTEDRDCGKTCASWWHNLGQVYQSLGKERPRVSLMRVEQVDTKLEQAVFRQLSNAIWIADPNGNLVLKYSFEEQPKMILKDLKKLLKVSRIG